MSKYHNIEWITVKPSGEFPPEKTKVLISFNAGDSYNFKAGTTEGYWGNPFIDFPEMKLDEKKKEQAFQNAYVPVSSFDPEWKQNPEDSGLIFKTLKSMGHDVREEGGEVFITNEAKAAIAKMQKQDVEFTANRIEAKLKDTSNRLQQIGSGLAELEQAGKGPGDKNFDALKAQEETLKKKLSILTRTFNDCRSNSDRHSMKYRRIEPIDSPVKADYFPLKQSHAKFLAIVRNSVIDKSLKGQGEGQY